MILLMVTNCFLQVVLLRPSVALAPVAVAAVVVQAPTVPVRIIAPSLCTLEQDVKLQICTQEVASPLEFASRILLLAQVGTVWLLKYGTVLSDIMMNRIYTDFDLIINEIQGRLLTRTLQALSAACLILHRTAPEQRRQLLW
jgi:multisubunit Na+/H+ antiporter MnhF subunit